MKANILIFCPYGISPNKGGIERVTDTLVREFMKAGHQVVVLSAHDTAEESNSAALHYVTRKTGNEEWILEIIRKHDIRVIIDQGADLSHYCPKPSLPAEVKVVRVMHDSKYAMYRRLQMNVLRKWHWRRVVTKGMRCDYAMADRIVVFVEPFKEEFRFFCPYAKDEKFAVIPNFNSYENPRPVRKEKTLLWVGRQSEWHKRTSDMLEIWSRLEDRFPDWSLDILGDGPDHEAVRRRYDALGLKRCRLRGNEDPKPYYEKASVFCMTSAFESFGMVLTEAMQHGCVPVAYDSYTAVRFIVHDGKDGLLVKPFDVDEYAEKLARLMTDGTERDRLAAAAVESVKQYDASNVFPKWIELIEELCRG